MGEAQANSFLYKLRALELLQYEKIVLIGVDSVVLKNIDQVFDCPAPCGVIDTWVWALNSAAPTVNGDFMVLKPSLEDQKNMLNLIAQIPKEDLATLKDGNNVWLGPYDQGLFNYYYGANLTALSWLIAGVEVLPMVIYYLDKFESYKNSYSVLHFPNSRPRPWEVGNVTQVFRWELVLFKYANQLYKDIEVEYASNLNVEEQKIYNSLSKMYYDFECDHGYCDASQPFRDKGDDPTLFELQYFVQRLDYHLQVGQAKQKEFGFWTATEKVKKVQAIIDSYNLLIQEEKAKRLIQ